MRPLSSCNLTRLTIDLLSNVLYGDELPNYRLVNGGGDETATLVTRDPLPEGRSS